MGKDMDKVELFILMVQQRMGYGKMIKELIMKNNNQTDEN
jgi:hypothetical protein